MDKTSHTVGLANAVWAPTHLAEIDVHVIIGGGFSEELLGTAYHIIARRVRERTDTYLDVLEKIILPRLDDSGLAATYLATLLRMAKLDEPVRVRRIALELRERTAFALLRTKKTSVRLQTRYAEFDALTR
jgi:hypothetical protein